MTDAPLFQDVIRKRRSVRKFEPGRSVGRDVLERIVDCGRWAPSGANVQCWDFIVVDDPAIRDKVLAVFLRQAQRLVDHAKGFPAVKKTYLANTVAIILVLGDPRWKVCFPQATSPEFDAEYRDNNEAIFYCSLGAAIQNIQLGVTAEGLTSAWLSGGGEAETNRETRRCARLSRMDDGLWHDPDRLSRHRPGSPLSPAARPAPALERLPAVAISPACAGRFLREHAAPLRHVPRSGINGRLAGSRRDAGRVDGRLHRPRQQPRANPRERSRLLPSQGDRPGHQAAPELKRLTSAASRRSDSRNPGIAAISPLPSTRKPHAALACSGVAVSIARM
ncbi:nitroreductase family protein [Bradyrhizobium guangxiense]